MPFVKRPSKTDHVEQLSCGPDCRTHTEALIDASSAWMRREERWSTRQATPHHSDRHESGPNKQSARLAFLEHPSSNTQISRSNAEGQTLSSWR